MDVTIQYIHHNCFLMRAGERTYLFDVPGAAHLPQEGGDLIRQGVTDADLLVFISHGHEDHLHDNLASMTDTARQVTYVLSDDVEDLRPEAVPANGTVHMVEPDERYVFDGTEVHTLMSNDLGVAFLVDDNGFRFTYGGDLAKWIWDTASPQEAAFTERFFAEALERMRDFGPQVAFANVDGRLPNLAGGVEACLVIRAPLFVPMHTFGNTGVLADFADQAGQGVSRLCLYEAPGDRCRIELE